MIIETPNGAVLEIFWRERRAKPWSQVTAHRFLSRFETGRDRLDGLRALMSDRADAGRTWRAPDTAILQRASWLISTGSVIVAEFGGTERWPGSGFILGSGPESALLFWRDKLRLHRDLGQVQEWLSKMQSLILHLRQKEKDKKSPTKEEIEGLKTNRAHIRSLRKLIASAPGVPDYGNLGDHDFLQVVEKFFTGGDLLPIYHRYPGAAEPDPVKPSDGPPPVKPPGGKDDPDDPGDDPFIPGVCLLRAASEGSPFVSIPESPAPGE